MTYQRGMRIVNDRAVAVLNQYDIEVNATRKGRGAIIADTDKGVFSLSEYTGRQDRLLFIKHVMDKIEENGFPYIDNLIANKEEELSVMDMDGKRYVLKRYMQGRECNVSDQSECCNMIAQIAKLHKFMEFKEMLEEEIVIKDFSKRELELTRARSFMRKQPQKGDFEIAFLKEFDYFQSVANKADSYLDKHCLDTLSTLVKQNGMCCHGECNQHNILNDGDHIAAVSFEKTGMDIQVRDLYLFLRKILEKNQWSFPFGIAIVESYEKEKPLIKEERQYLYARLLYPERYWKIANAYLNKRKSLPPRRQIEKLSALMHIEIARSQFLSQLEREWNV